MELKIDMTNHVARLINESGLTIASHVFDTIYRTNLSIILRLDGRTSSRFSYNDMEILISGQVSEPTPRMLENSKYKCTITRKQGTAHGY